MLIRHFSEVQWDSFRWPNFRPGEPGLACRHCGEFYMWPEAFDALQIARNFLGKPISLTSGHRCIVHNANVGGAPLSMHKTLAFDILTEGHDRASLARACRMAGFRGFGGYTTFLHVDLGASRRWYSGEQGRKLWLGLI